MAIPLTLTKNWLNWIDKMLKVILIQLLGEINLEFGDETYLS